MTNRRNKPQVAGVIMALVLIAATGAMIYGVIMLSGWAAVWVLLAYGAFLGFYALVLFAVAISEGWGMDIMG